MRPLLEALRDPNRRRGQAFRHALWRWRHLIGYVILVIGVIYAIAVEHTHSTQSREALAQETHATLVQGCERGNELRGALRRLVASSQPPHSAVTTGKITEEQYRQGLKFQRATQHVLRPINCATAYPAPSKG
jgi:hypothetical protein